MTAREVFDACVRYLLAAGWYRDGDDLGIWIQPARRWASPLSVTLGVALEIQLARDGVSLLEAVSGG